MFRCLVFALAALPGGVALYAQSETPFVFRDVATDVGLTPAASEIQAHGAGWGDVDGDGWADLYLATFHYGDTKPNLFFRNRSGRLSLNSQSSLRISTRGTGVVFADLDNDGDLDLYVASMPGPSGSKLAERHGHAFAGCSIFRNLGNGTFTDDSRGNAACPEKFGGRSAAVLDFDGDGLLDLLVGEDPLPGYNGSPTRRSRLFRNLGAMRFQDVSDQVGIPSDAAGLGVAVGDVNGDTYPDFFLASTIGNYLMINDGQGKFSEAVGARKTFTWPDAKGDNMICGVCIADVNGDALPDIVLGQHFDAPWNRPVANRLYLNRGTSDGVPAFSDVSGVAGLLPLPMKAPHVEIQDFDNDGRPDIYTSIVLFDDQQPHPVIFKNTGNQDGIPHFEQFALSVNDFPTEDDRATKGSRQFFEKMISERKIIYSAPGPTSDFDRDGRLDMVMPSWWTAVPTMLLKNESDAGNWLQVKIAADSKQNVNSMGIGSRVDIYRAGDAGKREALLGSREIQVGYGYASGQEAIAHFGLGTNEACDLIVTLPHRRGALRMRNVKCNQRLTISTERKSQAAD